LYNGNTHCTMLDSANLSPCNLSCANLSPRNRAILGQACPKPSLTIECDFRHCNVGNRGRP
ncbi:MAG: hypothetical protein RR652_06205, partial [Mucinivorans sp.]